MPLPISVVVPHQKSRGWFFERFTLPSIRANDPAEILIEDQEGGSCDKRNAGAHRATQPYIIFVDDDEVLGCDCLKKMMSALDASVVAGYAYSGYTAIIWPGVKGPMSGNYIVPSRPFDEAALRTENYIDTTSLIRREVFPGFDPDIRRFQDWDLWLTLLGRGIHGTFIAEPLFMKFFIDEGITAKVPTEEPGLRVRRKHHLL